MSIPTVDDASNREVCLAVAAAFGLAALEIAEEAVSRELTAAAMDGTVRKSVTGPPFDLEKWAAENGRSHLVRKAAGGRAYMTRSL